VAVARSGGTLAGRDAARRNNSRRSSSTGDLDAVAGAGACGGGTVVEVKRGEKKVWMMKRTSK
jgi:hypothetical protein